MKDPNDNITHVMPALMYSFDWMNDLTVKKMHNGDMNIYVKNSYIKNYGCQQTMTSIDDLVTNVRDTLGYRTY